MKIYITKPLFDWDAVESSPSLRTIREFLEAIPDGKLLAMLNAYRGKGRNDYPVRVLWGVVLLTCVLRHTHIQHCLDELKRNPALRKLIGIKNEDRVPKSWNISRFMNNLGREPFLSEVGRISEHMTDWLIENVDSLGRELSGDGTHLSARRSEAEKGKSQDESELPLAEGGRKEYVEEDGKVKEAFEWYGYKLLLVVDNKHEVVLGWKLVSANSADCVGLRELIDETMRKLPEGRAESLVYDRAADDGKIYELLDFHGVKPIVKIRRHWSGESERLLDYGGKHKNIVYDEFGTVYCYDTESEVPVRHRMYYYGYEKSTDTLKYRCPARVEGRECPSEGKCNKGKKYGLTVRIKREIDRRRFVPLPRASKKFKRLLNGRSAVERVNARLKVFWGADDGNITGAERFHAWISVVMIVHSAMAVLLASAERWEGKLSHTRLSAVAKALRSKWTNQLSK